MQAQELPEKEELVVAMADHPLGNGSEARVYKIHTRPQFTLRVSQDLHHSKNIAKNIMESKLVPQKDIFSGRCFGQTVAYLDYPDLMDSYSHDPMITINYYSRGHDYTIVKDTQIIPPPEETLSRTIAVTKMLVDQEIFPDKAYDSLFDKLQFLSSRQYTIDVGNGLFSNTGNVLPSVEDHKFFIIDVMPFISSEKLRLAIKPPLNPKHTKGCNTPLFVSRGLMYGYFSHQPFHQKNKELLNLRVHLLNRIIDSAARMHVSDRNSYLFDVETSWKRQMHLLNIPEIEQKKLLNKISKISDNQPYHAVSEIAHLARIGGWYINQQ